jgi:hypothetical protein
MVNNNDERNNENGGRTTIEVSLKNREFKKVEKLAEESGESVEKFTHHNIHQAIHHAELKEVIAEGCSDGRISENSKVCRAIEKGQEQNHHVY